MSYQTLILDVADGVAMITMNRPEAANALDLTMSKELAAVAIRCDEDPDIRAAVLTGAGRFFSAGGDMAGFGEAGDGAGALIKEMTMHLHGAVSRFARMDPPLIAAVNGMAAGGGWSLALSCDLVFAGESAQFLSAYTASSLSPDGSSTYFVPRNIGLRRTAELMLTNRKLSAAEALDWGLINRVVGDDDVVDEAQALAAELAKGATLAFGAVKRLLHQSLSSSLETQMEMEARMIADMTRTNDGKEGVTAFLEKRRPDFTGT